MAKTQTNVIELNSGQVQRDGSIFFAMIISINTPDCNYNIGFSDLKKTGFLSLKT